MVFFKYPFIEIDNLERKISGDLESEFFSCDITNFEPTKQDQGHQQFPGDYFLKFSKYKYQRKDDRWIFDLSYYVLFRGKQFYKIGKLEESNLYICDAINLIYQKFIQYLDLEKNILKEIEQNKEIIRKINTSSHEEILKKEEFGFYKNQIKKLRFDRRNNEIYIKKSAKHLKEALLYFFSSKAKIILKEFPGITFQDYKKRILESDKIPYAKIFSLRPKSLEGYFEELNTYINSLYFYPRIINEKFAFWLIEQSDILGLDYQTLTKCLQLRFNYLFSEISNNVALDNEQSLKIINETIFCKERLSVLHKKLGREHYSRLAEAESIWLMSYSTDDKKKIIKFYNSSISLLQKIDKHNPSKSLKRKIALLKPRKYERLAQVEKNIKKKIYYYNKANILFADIHSRRSYFVGFLRDYFLVINALTSSYITKGSQIADQIKNKYDSTILRDYFPEIDPYINIIQLISFIPVDLPTTETINILNSKGAECINNQKLEISKWYQLIYAYNLMGNVYGLKISKKIMKPLILELIVKNGDVLKNIAKSFAQEIMNGILTPESSDSFDLIKPETPFSNIMKMSSVFDSCSKYLFWVDKYFSVEGLKLLSQFLNKNEVKEIKILMSLDKADEKIRSLFKDFKLEMKNKGVICELKVITDRKLTSQIHDRWIISKEKCFNVPSPDVIARGQYSEIKPTENRPPFDQWWNNNLDIITEWDKIKAAKVELQNLQKN